MWGRLSSVNTKDDVVFVDVDVDVDGLKKEFS